jgi:hypothetical protein
MVPRMRERMPFKNGEVWDKRPDFYRFMSIYSTQRCPRRREEGGEINHNESELKVGVQTTCVDAHLEGSGMYLGWLPGFFLSVNVSETFRN